MFHFMACYVTKCPLSISLWDNADVEHHLIISVGCYEGFLLVRKGSFFEDVAAGHAVGKYCR